MLATGSNSPSPSASTCGDKDAKTPGRSIPNTIFFCGRRDPVVGQFISPTRVFRSSLSHHRHLHFPPPRQWFLSAFHSHRRLPLWGSSSLTQIISTADRCSHSDSCGEILLHLMKNFILCSAHRCRQSRLSVLLRLELADFATVKHRKRPTSATGIKKTLCVESRDPHKTGWSIGK